LEVLVILPGRKTYALPKGAIMHGIILVYGNDEMLVTTRRLIFEQAGYEVFTAYSLSNAALALMNHQIDVLVLCQTLSDQERSAVLETAHTLQPKIKYVSLSLGGMNGIYTQQWSMNPAALLAAIGQILQEKTA
jgi:hypothetical protein